MLRDVVRSLFRAPFTQNYPAERTATPKRLRGMLTWDPTKCSGCTLCVKDCPANAIELVKLDAAKKQFVLRYHADRCTYCAQCVVNCRFDCLGMSPDEWELAALTKEPFLIDYGTEENLALFREKFAPTDSSQSDCRD
jgi:NAD(P)H-quinone oxidoreductase subunit I